MCSVFSFCCNLFYVVIGDDAIAKKKSCDIAANAS